MIGPRQMTGSVSSSSKRFIDITSMPVLVIAGRIPISVPIALSVIPNIRGMEGPVISASRIAVLYPLRCAVTASIAVVRDLPTPPLPLTMPMTFLILLNSCGAFCISRREHSSPQLPQSCVHSAIIMCLRVLNYSRSFGSYSAFLNTLSAGLSEISSLNTFCHSTAE